MDFDHLFETLDRQPSAAIENFSAGQGQIFVRSGGLRHRKVSRGRVRASLIRETKQRTTLFEAALHTDPRVYN